MTHEVLEVTANPPLELTAATTVYTGTVRLGRQGAMHLVVRGQPLEEFGFFVPEAPPLADAAEQPAVWAEVNLMFASIIDARYEMGVDRVTAGYLADPRGGTARWLHCGGMAHAPTPIRISYRITVQQRSQAG